MSDLTKYIIDGVAGVALFMALIFVFLVDFLIGWVGSGPAKNTLDNVTKVEVARTHGSKKMKLGVTKTGEQNNPDTKQLEKYDDMGKLLKALGSGYSYDDLSIDDLIANPNKIKEYSVVFLTCNLGGEEEMKDILRNYVAEGGILYASDLRYDAIAKAFPTEKADHLVGQGHPQELFADIVDQGMYEYLTADEKMAKELKGRRMHLKFELGGWRPAAFDSSRTTVLLKGTYKKLQLPGKPDPGNAVAPLMVKFQIDKGMVIFTSFHNEKQNSDVEKKLLEYLVFSLVNAGADADINSKLNEKGGFAPQRSNLLSTPKRNQTITKKYKNEKVADLRFALAFRDGEGAKLRFKLVSPDKKEHTWEGSSSVILDVTAAKEGEWTYEVTSLDLPYENFPFSVTVGEKKKQ